MHMWSQRLRIFDYRRMTRSWTRLRYFLVEVQQAEQRHAPAHKLWASSQNHTEQAQLSVKPWLNYPVADHSCLGCTTSCFRTQHALRTKPQAASRWCKFVSKCRRKLQPKISMSSVGTSWPTHYFRRITKETRDSNSATLNPTLYPTHGG